MNELEVYKWEPPKSEKYTNEYTKNKMVYENEKTHTGINKSEINIPKTKWYKKRYNWTPKRVKKLREKFEIGQEQFADVLGMRQSHISDIENGKRKVPKRVIPSLELMKEHLK